MRHGVPTACIPDPLRHHCVRPYHDPHDVNYGGPHEQNAFTTDYDNGRMDGFVRARETCGNVLDPKDCIRELVGRHDGLPRPARDPQLLDLRARLRAPGPHVRAQRLVEPAGAPVPGLGMVGALHDRRRSVQLQLEHRGSRTPDRHRTGAAQAARLCVDRPHLPALPAPRQLGLLHEEGSRAGLRDRRDVLPVPRPGPAHARHLEPAAELRHGPPGQPAREHPRHQRVLHRRAQGTSAGGLVGDPERGRQRAPDLVDSRGPGLRHRPDQRDRAQPRLEQHRDLPRLGRLGRFLRPRRARRLSI